MDKNYFLQLLQKHLRGEATPAEDQFLEKYYDVFESEPDVMSLLNAESKHALQDDMYKVISQNISSTEMNHTKGRRINGAFIIKLAAAVVFVAVCTTTILYTRSVKPGIKISSVPAVEKRENRLLVLPDGSKVIVTWGTKFYYQPSFNSVKREVYLEGEAYFDISHDGTKPFVVHTGTVETTVLGTAFNVKAIPGQGEITVTVTRGKVRITDRKKVLRLITRGEQVSYYTKKDSITHKMVGTNIKMDWKEQDLFVDNVTVEEAAHLLSDRFDVSIAVSDSLLKKNRFTTVFLKTESLEQILKSICEFNYADYQYDKQKKAMIIFKRERQRPGVKRET